jgi:hypothetical protein
MHAVSSAHEAREARGDVEPMVGLAVRSQALQARGAEVQLSALPACPEPLACAGLPVAAGGTRLTGGW